MPLIINAVRQRPWCSLLRGQPIGTAGNKPASPSGSRRAASFPHGRVCPSPDLVCTPFEARY